MKRVRKKELVARLIAVEHVLDVFVDELRTTKTKLSRAIDDIATINRRQRDRQ